MSKKKQEPKPAQTQATDLPSYRWFTLLKTEVGYCILEVETNGYEVDPETLKVYDPDILAIALKKLEGMIVRNARNENSNH